MPNSYRILPQVRLLHLGTHYVEYPIVAGSVNFTFRNTYAEYRIVAEYCCECDFFIWEHIKDLVFVPPLPKTLEDLRKRIHAAMMTIDRMTLQNVWNKFDYCLDV
ncbi:hypothetical protein AVEN_27829-1 [Araneus ventricosus]|uniref:Uncharacterized protein n=1 Tax=Araneus ventricosus TaxID=182803 RepID=A0A4Y2GRD8_ARAVE|nr:hypothetical protein AVEN_27829-1 [Araneus ventricosus]